MSIARDLPRSLLIILGFALLVNACSSEGSDESPHATVTTKTPADTVPANTTAPMDTVESEVDLRRVVVLGEDFLLADVLALGIDPVAATATLGDEFSGIERDTSGIVPLPATDPNFERLAAFDPTLIVASEFVANTAGTDILEGIAPTIVVMGADWRTQVTALGEAVGQPAKAATLLADYDAAVEFARTLLPESFEVTAATVYPGPNLAAWVDGPTNIPQTLIDLGATLVPGAGRYDNERFGRAFLSRELVSELSGPMIVLIQSDAVDGESEALEELMASELFTQLPAARDGRVAIVDRLGYPGVEGRTRLIDVLVDAIGGS